MNTYVNTVQAGISIVLRKKVREQSLFKFLNVLKPEVWFAICGAVVVTALLLWLLDRYSPYSARNNKAAYPYPCRDDIRVAPKLPKTEPRKRSTLWLALEAEF